LSKRCNILQIACAEIEQVTLAAFDLLNAEFCRGELQRPGLFDWHYRGRHADVQIHHLRSPGGDCRKIVELRMPLFRPDLARPEIFLSELLMAMLSQWVQDCGEARSVGYKPRAWRNHAIKLGLACPRPGACGKMTIAKTEIRLDENGRASRFFRKIIAETDFGLPVMVPTAELISTGANPRSISEMKRIRRNASKTDFVCPENGPSHAHLWGRPGSSGLCGVCWTERRAIVFLVPRAGKRFGEAA
jgi:hypothetical protein